MRLHAAGDDSRRALIVSLLFEPVLQAMHGARMLLSGLERQGDQDDPAAPLFAQEWAIEVMQEPPADLSQTPHRPPI